MVSDSHVVRIELPSSFDLLDLVQIVSDRLSAMAGMEEDAMHWVSVAVRESVINAIKHGNKEDRAKQVTVENRRRRKVSTEVRESSLGNAERALLWIRTLLRIGFRRFRS